MIAGLRAQLAGTANIDWRDPLRMSIAALLAYGAATALHLPEAFWAVLSALVVSRPHRGGTMQAGVGRFAGTLAGVGWAMVVAAGRHWQIDEVWLLLALLAPLTALVAWRADWRTAPIAAVIVLSSAPHGSGAPLAAAALRLAEITLGAGTGMAVAWLLLPAGSLRRAESLTARLLDALAGLLDSETAQHLSGQHLSGRRPMEASRRLLQHLTAASRAAPWEGGDHARAEQLAALAARLHGDVGFLRRCLATTAATAAEEQRIAACRAALHGLALQLRGQDGALRLGGAGQQETTATGALLAMLEQDIAALARLVSTAPRIKNGGCRSSPTDKKMAAAEAAAEAGGRKGR